MLTVMIGQVSTQLLETKRRLAMLEKMFGLILSFTLVCMILGIKVSDAAIVLPKPSLFHKLTGT